MAKKELQKATDVQKMLARYAEDDAAREVAGGGNNISIRGGKFSYQGGTLGREINVIILDFSHVKTFYDRDFDENNPSPPACMAVNRDGKDMEPVEGAPSKQAEACSVCPHNKFGTAERGKGKACKDGRRLAVLDADAEDLSEAEIAILVVPPASLKNWSGYERNLHARLKVPAIGVITKISMDEDAEFTTLDFEVSKPLTDKKLLAMLLNRRKEAQDMLLGVPDFSGYEPASGGKKSKAKKEKAAPREERSTKKAGKSKFSAR